MSPPLTIAQLLATPGSGWGGMEQHTLSLAQALAARGHRVHVLAHPDYANRFPQPLNFQPLPMQLGRRNPWLRRRLRRSLRQLAADVVHAQGNKAAALLSGTELGEAVRLGTLHGVKSSHADFARLDAIIAVSKGVFESIQHPRKQLIYNGIVPQASQPRDRLAALSPHHARPLVIAAGRLEPVKGFESLIRAWAHLAPAGQLVIVGQGNQQPQLQALINDSGLQQCITLAGYRNDLRDWLGHADACVLSSQREGFGYLVIEALQAGCPVLATPVGCAPELLPPDCLAVDSSGPALQNLLQQHLPRLTQLRAQQADAMARAREHFTLVAMTEQTEACYRALLSAGAGP
ncbi:glycosyltransferase [Marinobacter sp. SS21]|uniref:glycosyltransferase n=1 Tax=Marinobacter sp. SS21 TaxID=2979460 RepID=UPI00232E7785|nr:glycosyltransferase [Marinobacter sp. SS21]MDC0663097.1 glycosyltransferase [Marinobacter sp. SS21]